MAAIIRAALAHLQLQVPQADSAPPFEPLAQVGLQWLSTKAAFLLAIASGKRVGELHALSVSDACLRWDSQVLPFGQMWRSCQGASTSPLQSAYPAGTL